MIHQVSCGIPRLPGTDVEIHAREILRSKMLLNEILARHTGRSIDQVRQDTDRDCFMSAREAAEYGLADRVLERGRADRDGLSPTRDAVRRVVDNVIEVREGREVFPHDVEIAFNGAYDKLLRAFDGLELSRDLIASVRDYLQAKIGNDQNEVMKRLTAIASLLLVPTFIVGLYGQNFVHHFPELHWRYGYLWSWTLIIATTIAQFVWYRRRRWI